MKIYRNKLYSIQDAAKRAGVTEGQIIHMINNNIITADKTYPVSFIRGEDILGLKGKWKEYQRILNIGKGGKGKKPKKAKVTMLRLDKGE